MQLPPIGQATPDTEGDIVNRIGDLADEARAARAEYEPWAEACLSLYDHGDDHIPNPDKIVVNQIRPAVIALTDVQTKEPPSATLEPVETGEPPTFYWAGPQHIGIGMGLHPSEVATWIGEDGQLQPPTPLDPMAGEQMKAMAIPKELVPMWAPGMIRPEWIVELDDRLVADTYQTVFDVYWQRSQVDLWVRANLLQTNIQGWAWGLYEFDEKRKIHVLRHLPIVQVYVDPTVADIADAAYAGFDLPMDADEAKASYPALTAAIDEHASTGPLNQVDRSTSWSSQYDRDYKRPMVTFRVFWLRNQMFPLSEEEALASGEVEEVQALDGLIQETGAGVPPSVPLADEGDGSADAGMAPEQEQPALPAVAAPAAPQYTLTGTGVPVAPGDPHWPTRTGIRQITTIANRLVDDRECEFADIPLLHNVAIPLSVPRPFGIGEPYSLRQIQKAMSRAMDSMVTHADYFAHPMVTVSQSMAAEIGDKLKGGYSKPGRTIVVPDDLLAAMGGKADLIHTPPPMSPALPEVFSMLKAEISEQSGHTPTMRGTAPSANASGKMVELLQQSGASMMGFKAKRTGDMLLHAAKEMHHSHVHRLSVADIKLVVSKYPDHVLEAIHAKARSMEWNITINIEAGGAGLLMQKIQMVQVLLPLGLISLQTACEMTQQDYRVEQQRIIAHQQKLAATMGMGATQPGQPGEEKKEKGPPKQGGGE